MIDGFSIFELTQLKFVSFKPSHQAAASDSSEHAQDFWV